MYLSYSFTSFYSQQQQFQGEGGQLVLEAPRTRKVLVHHNPNSYLYQDLWNRPGEDLIMKDGWMEAASVEVGSSTPLSPTITSSKLHINALPTELLTAIFLYCLSSTSGLRTDSNLHQYTPDNAPLLLCRVCSYWRRLARATPFLWRELDLGGVRPKMRRRSRQPSIEIHPTPQPPIDRTTFETTLEAGPLVNTHHGLIAYTEILPIPSTFLMPVVKTNVEDQNRSLLNLSSLAHLFATLSRPLSFKFLKMRASRYRIDGVKTDYERLNFGFSGGIGVFYGESSGEGIDALNLTSGDGTVVPQMVVESVLFARNGSVARHVVSLDLTLDEPTDIPRISIFVSPRPTLALSAPFRPQFSLPTLHRLALRMAHLSLTDFEWPPWVGPVHIQLKGVVDLLKFGWGFVPAVRSSSFEYGAGDRSDSMDPSPAVEVEPNANETTTPPPCEGDEGWTTAFSLPSIVPSLKEAELDVPWVVLLPGRYGTRSLSLHPSSASSLLPSLSILPYTQLQSLTLVRPIPVWIFRALLVECVSLKVAQVRLLSLSPNFGQVDAAQQGGAGGGANGDAEDDGTPRADQEFGVYWERVCTRAFGGDPVGLIIGVEGTPNDDRETHSLSLDSLEELRLTIQCSPQTDDRILTDRVRRMERERWPNLEVVFPLPPPFTSDPRPESGRDGSPSSWKGALRPSVELSEKEERLVEYALRGFGLPSLRALEVLPSKT
ncbi:hypothetical protein H1R20_g15857, partial [Candolleomyces eurysporus]